MKNDKKHVFLRTYLEHLQQNGRYTFTKSEALEAMQCPEVLFRQASVRAQNKKMLIQPKRGFFVIVPVEYRLAGSPPPAWFIHDLMKFIDHPYYVALLSASALYGAAHQQPQVFQIITDKQMPDIKVSRVHIRFIYKKEWPKSWVEPIKTYTGTMQISKPSTTAIDLARYIEHGGYIDNIMLVVGELSERITSDELASSLDENYCQTASIQRLGYLFEANQQDELANVVEEWLIGKTLNYIPLLPHADRNHKINKRWRVIVNHEVEVDI